MAKKSRRARTAVPSQPASSTVTPVVLPVRPVRVLRTPVAQAPKEVDFGKEYHYVIKDLKLTFLIAGALLVAMIVLALFIA